MADRVRRSIPVWLAAGLLTVSPAQAARGWATVKIEIHGVDAEQRRNVMQFLSIAQPLADDEPAEWRVRALHARAPDEIRNAMQPFGYYHATVEGTLEPAAPGWRAVYHISPGPPVRIARVDLVLRGPGADDPAFRGVADAPPIREGEPLHHERYEQTKRALQDLAAERGYFDARFVEQTLRVDPQANRADIVLHYDTGPRYRFGPVRFEQTGGLAPDLLARYVDIRPGEPYRRSALLALQKALSDSEYFQQVEVRPERDRAVDLAVPIRVTLTARKPDRYSIGLGYGTDTGVRGKLGWERRLARARGDRLAVEVVGSEIHSTVDLRYLIPVGDPRTDRVTYFAGWTDAHPEFSDSQVGKAGASYTHMRRGWRETWSLTYHDEKFRVGATDGHSALLIPGGHWLYLAADKPLAPSRGWRATFELRGAAEALASDVSFVQARAHAKLIWPLGAGRVIARGDLGATSVSRFEDLPATLRFYTGGDQSVRGYAYNTVGPRDALGDVIGGKHLAVGSLEVEYPIVGKWSGAAFYDVGRAYTDTDEPYAEGAGFGVRWRSPIGPLRLDVASALSRPDRPWRIHLVVGPDL
jgi:translocation and assembly module TamA